MTRVVALVEGQTERNFCEKLLAPHLGNFGIGFSPKVIGKPGHKGGNRWAVARREIVALLKQRPHACTTMFDLYGMPGDWPGKADSDAKCLKHEAAASFIENALLADIAAAFGSPPADVPFIPYLSLYEYEALLFSDPSRLASVTQGPTHAAQFSKIVEECKGCETINGDPLTAPSKRILRIAPNYKKTWAGVVAAERIGLPTIRSKCPHFQRWIMRLETLATGLRPEGALGV